MHPEKTLDDADDGDDEYTHPLLYLHEYFFNNSRRRALVSQFQVFTQRQKHIMKP